MYPQHVDERWRHLDEGSEGCKEVVGQTLTNKRLKTETLLELNRISRHGDFLRIFRQFHYYGPSGSVAEPLG